MCHGILIHVYPCFVWVCYSLSINNLRCSHYWVSSNVQTAISETHWPHVCLMCHTSNTVFVVVVVVVVVTEREAWWGLDDPEAGARHQHEGQGLPGEGVFCEYPTATLVHCSFYILKSENVGLWLPIMRHTVCFTQDLFTRPFMSFTGQVCLSTPLPFTGVGQSCLENMHVILCMRCRGSPLQSKPLHVGMGFGSPWKHLCFIKYQWPIWARSHNRSQANLGWETMYLVWFWVWIPITTCRHPWDSQYPVYWQ